MFTPTRAFFVTDAVIDDYVAYRRRASRDTTPGIQPLYFQQWFDNLWQAQPIDQLVGHD